jgi:hypothetical protein
MTDQTKISVHYSTIDRFSIRRTFATLAGAQRFAAKYLGDHPEIGRGYAISSDGIGRVTCQGCALSDLFPAMERV